MEEKETYQALEGHGLETKTGYSWFLMQCTWEPENDSQAIKKWGQVYLWFRPEKDTKEKKISYRKEISNKGFLALNLIGQRTFIIAGQAKTNRPLQELSSLITLGTQIQVDLYSATNVFDFAIIMQSVGQKDFTI